MSRTFEKVLEKVQEEHTELDCPAMHFAAGNAGLNVGIGKSDWPGNYPQWPSGFWLGALRLEDLASEEEELPYAMVYIAPPKNIQIDPAEAADKFAKEAKGILAKEDFDRVEDWSGKREAQIYCLLPQLRRDLLDLLKNDDGSGFIECMVAHFDLLAKFAPVVDEIFQVSKRSRK